MLKSLVTHRHAFKFYALIAFLYLVAPLITFLHNVFDYSLTFGLFEPTDDYFDKVNFIERTQFSLLTLGISVVWTWRFWLESKTKNYKIHAISGMVGVFFSLISLSLISHFQWKILVFVFGVSGFLCIYCISVPMYSWIFAKFKRKDWEPVFIVTTLGGGGYYLLSGYAAIMLNNVFSVNASYFPFTLPVAKFLLLAPFLVVGSILSLFVILWKEHKTKVTDNNTFYNLNKMMVCFTLIILCSALGSRRNEVLEVVATKFDFNSKSTCFFKEPYNGYIVLDPAHNKVLTYSKERGDQESPYVVRLCELKSQ